ncbi:DUF433 domain-containing protein [Schumannella luteola]|uniref:DUF433 domain-containing protein n=1 Tax=Schumannella luteola TaxID=472059 RepID=UPI0011720414|nr:DUF433 domain-containing protein [Schumannella luteola]TPX04266.1 DUF433 domain-containing protein [Schumannella luteola]
MYPEIPREYLIPLYSQSDAARIVSVSGSTVHRWINGYRDGSTEHPPVIGSASAGRGLTIPFIGLAEIFVLNAFRKAGLPLQRIRPAVEILKNGIGLEHALANGQLLTDGAEILFDSKDPGDRRLVVVRNGDAVFNEVVEDYLRHIDFGDFGYASVLRLPQYPGPTVQVDPRINGGRPSLASRSVSVDDVLSRLRAGESIGDVADDYGVGYDDVLNLNRLAA